MATKSLARTYSAELDGINAKLIEVEVDINVGLHAFNIVGLADRALNEARERVNSALKNSGTKPPNRENRKITVNLAPADVRKTGSHYDLAIALGYLSATKQISHFETAGRLFVGELALDGRLRPVNGTLNIAELAAKKDFVELFVPEENFEEASVMQNIAPRLKIISIMFLRDAIQYLETGILEKCGGVTQKKTDKENPEASRVLFPDFSEIVGQENAKRVLTIGAAGGHNVLMVGPPGVGKSMLARALAGILPDLSLPEAIEVTKIWSAAGISPGRLMSQRPFRAPHQTTSMMALVGGGANPKPGEISLAHRGILFLDELPEFQDNALEALRDPMESGVIRVARARGSFVFPSRFSLVAAMNPCPCGFYGNANKECKCTPYEVIKYEKKISGPLMDRIDMQIQVGRINIGELRKNGRHEGLSRKIKVEIETAREIQSRRFGNRGMTNSEMTSRETHTSVKLDSLAEDFLEALARRRISPRGYYRILKVARTIADLENSEQVSADHLAEAFSYRFREPATA